MNAMINVQHLDGQLLVSSLEVAKNFKKEHKHVLEKVDLKRKELNKLVESSTDINDLKIFMIDNFLEDFYVDEKGREQRQILLTRDGFSFITMGFTGIRADTWKLKYIETFNKMEQQLSNPFMKLSRELQAIFAIDKKQQEIEISVKKVEVGLEDLRDNAPLYNIECDELIKSVRKAATRSLGGYKSKAYNNKSLRAKVYQDIQHQLRREFGIESYKAIKRCQLEKALKISNGYELPFYLEEQVTSLNNQLIFNEA